MIKDEPNATVEIRANWGMYVRQNAEVQVGWSCNYCFLRLRSYCICVIMCENMIYLYIYISMYINIYVQK